MKEFWNERYQSKEYFYGKNPNDFLTKVIGILPEHAQVLCIAEGEGRNAVYLAKKSFKVSAVDFSQEAKQKALDLATQNNVDINYHVSDLETFDFGIKKWDAVISIFCHLADSSRRDIHQRIEKSLKPQGFFIVQAYNKKQLEFNSGGPKDSSMLYTLEKIKNDFNGFHWIKIEDSIILLAEGIGHIGKSSVLSGIAQLIN